MSEAQLRPDKRSAKRSAYQLSDRPSLALMAVGALDTLAPVVAQVQRGHRAVRLEGSLWVGF